MSENQTSVEVLRLNLCESLENLRLRRGDKFPCSVRADLTSSSVDHPVVVYQVVSDVPHLWGDDIELARRITVQISAITTDGDDAEMVRIIRKTAEGLGWMRESTERFTQGRMRITALRYILAESEDET